MITVVRRRRVVGLFDPSVEYTAAVFVTVPAGVSGLTCATTVIVRVAPTASVPNWHTAPPQTPPFEAEAEAKVKPAGSWSFTSTLRARPGPVLVMRIV